MKSSSQELAVLGGTPEFAVPLLTGRPNIGDEAGFRRRMDGILASRLFTNDGPLVREFEARIAALTGAPHCIATCNATQALELALEALEISGSVILPSFTFIATAHALARRGVRPIFCDVEPGTHNIDPALAEGLIDEDTSAILGVHLWGRPCRVERLEAIARERGLHLLFDAAHAFGAAAGGRMVGTFGDAEVFSFHATKAINSFEGGAIVTADGALAQRLRESLNFGFGPVGEIVRVGTNAKMSEPCAAMGLSSLDAMEAIFAHNRAIHDDYARGLWDVPGLALQGYGEQDAANYQYVVVEVDAPLFGLTRNELLAVLAAENVGARPYFSPGCHRSEPYASMPGGPPVLPVTERLCDTVICLPTGTSVRPEDVARLCRVVALAGGAGPQVAAELGRRDPA